MSVQDLPFFPIAGGTSGDVGKDGISPTITSAAIDGGHRLTIVDAAGTKTIDIMNGLDGASGKDGDSGVYVGATVPTDVNANVWINPNGEAVSLPTGDGSYTLPVATADTLGGVKPVAKSDNMTQSVGVDEVGGLWTVPGSGSSGFNDNPLELIAETTLSDDARGVTFDKDLNNEAFELEDFYLWVQAKLNVFGNGHIVIYHNGGSHFLMNCPVGVGADAELNDYSVRHIFNAGQVVLNAGVAAFGSFASSLFVSKELINRPVTGITIYPAAAAANYLSGGQFKLYGRRVKK